ncbi:MAG: LPXTG cell wall anchor domain-containing protein [Acidobacteria bacterium]|nr:LPXTG cell wall anchor domain-containing protein [Acidobacteriota bacterium]
MAQNNPPATSEATNEGKANQGKGSLPNTGSELPLLALLGFASTLAGIYLRK